MRVNKISMRMVKEKGFNLEDKISSNFDVVRFLNKYEDFSNLPEECMVILTLNNKNFVTNYGIVAIGGGNYSYVDVKSIARLTLLSGSNKIIMVHNHPSGDCEPSSADYEVTRKVRSALEVLDIKLLDHIVIGSDDDFKSILDILN